MPRSSKNDLPPEEAVPINVAEEARRIYADDLVEPEVVSPLRNPRGEPTLSSIAAKVDQASALVQQLPTRQLHRKLAEVMEAVTNVPKRGRAPAAMGGFEFVQVGDAAAAIRRELAQRHVTLMPARIELLRAYETETKGGSLMTNETYKVTWIFVDGDTGETHVIESVGTGSDRGDKASPKAQTNAMKYALLMAFLMPTGDDPELEDSSDRQKSAPVIGDSNATGVLQGGRQTQSTQAQIIEIGRFARDLNLGPSALAAVIDSVLPNNTVPPFDETDKSLHILGYLRGLSHDEAAQIVQVLMASRQSKEAANGDAEPDDPRPA